MTIGKTLLRIRMDRGMTQGELGERAGLATSYISRIENGRIQPTLKTLTRVTEALGVPLAEVFGDDRARSSGAGGCPVSSSGECIGVLLRSQNGRKPKRQKDCYTGEDVRLLRMTDYLMQHGSKDVREALTVVLESLLLRAGEKSRSGKKLFAE